MADLDKKDNKISTDDAEHLVNETKINNPGTKKYKDFYKKIKFYSKL